VHPRRVCPGTGTVAAGVGPAESGGGLPSAVAPSQGLSARGAAGVARGLPVGPSGCAVEEKGVKWLEMV
jgi:hypothetical protein